ncbi:MAG: Dabb family protein [Pyrinomonadaceae bacterium]|nr:Dabb family protein [Pyrinomonadaceae bacterium]
MLVHIVAWKYKKETDSKTRADHISKLHALPGVIRCIESFKVGSDILNLDRSYDTGLVAEFADATALEEYTVHPAHQEVASMGKEIAEHVVSVDFLTK